MPKAVALTSDLVEAPQVTPQAATPARAAPKKEAPAKTGDEIMPLQMRLPRQEVKAIKLAALQREQTVSEFMLACFHACMK